MSEVRSEFWSPYVVGAGIGVLSWFALATAKRTIGVTAPFEETAAMAHKALAPESSAIADYQQAKQQEPSIGWEWMLVPGIALGSYLASRGSSSEETRAVPRLWRQRYGGGRLKRYAAAYAGGALMMYGARMAQGCTSGHGISGTMKFAGSSWVFSPLIFAVSSVVSRLLLGRRPDR